ncbi:MAG: hypothetical protein KKA05_01135 [Alphaproteobacteria bacterium]|nr:hypothetical protein [Alphaproteobacteria bacterium]
MGTIIHVDFSKRAAARVEEPEFAIVKTLGGAFRDDTLFRATPVSGGYHISQYERGVTPDTALLKKPLAKMSATADDIESYFVPLRPDMSGGIVKPFTKSSEYYTLAVRAVHVVLDSGLFQPADEASAGHYRAGDAIVEFVSGATQSGPAQEMLARLVPLDEDAEIALSASQEHLKVRPNGPAGFEI